MTITPLERLRAAADRSAPLVPVAATFGYLIDSVEPGALVARLPALPPAVLRGPGAVLPLVDMVLSAVISTVLPGERAISTLTMHWAGAGALPPPGTTLVATGSVLSVDEDDAISTGTVVDGAGAVVATISSRAALMPRPGAMVGAGEVGPAGGAGFAELQVTRGPQDWRALGVASLSNLVGNVQGGVLAAVAAHAVDEVIGAARPHLAGAAADLDVTFLRPVRADGSAFAVTAEPIRTGMRLAAARAEVRDGVGRLAAVVNAAHWRGSGSR